MQQAQHFGDRVMAKMSGNAALSKYSDELIATAKKITAPGKGILAADESTGTIGKRVSARLV